jgi:hypothetical protein
MAITAGWYDETQRVILQRYQGRWTWEELSIAAGTTRALTASVPHTVVLFIDMSDSNQIPQGNVLSQGRAIFNMMPSNMTQIIVVAQSQIIEIFANLVVKMLPNWRNRVKFVKSIEEGKRLLAETLGVNTL